MQRYGPLSICIGGTVTFGWTGMHGVFQIPTIACPSNYTSGETAEYKFLSAAANGGQYVWQTPNATGHYWITSQYMDDCNRGEWPAERLRAGVEPARRICNGRWWAPLVGGGSLNALPPRCRRHGGGGVRGVPGGQTVQGGRPAGVGQAGAPFGGGGSSDGGAARLTAWCKVNSSGAVFSPSGAALDG